LNLAEATWGGPAFAAFLALALWWLLVVRPERRRMRAADDATATPDFAPGESPAARAVLLAVGLGIAIVIWVAGERPMLAAAVFVVWNLVTVIMRSRARARRALEQERYAVESISGASRALRAGIPLGGMLEILAVEGRGEAGRAFREIVRRESLGEDLASAIRRVLLRSPLPALRAFGLAVIVQINAGGNLADTTDRLARSLVERGRMRRRARTIVSYSRAAATVLSVLPLLAVPLMAWLVDDYLTLLLDRPAGNILLAVSAVLLVAGIASIQRFGRIDGTESGRPA
jgi:tight adherence protein B